ncbi:MAG: orotate phosphoribosyltransferase [Gammaproteobacteria bacterium]|nr:orotate phosphoribosyltransferase [Gammaproteobacteria bacterium]MAY03243.1 orotate phosphoribosyltransferase [Gammaproteobacteria bacterium]|tara:strand:- start:200234 stop:200881 length:648 start_codon:yes stop_codon:yes gene_type:complete
MKHFQTEFLDFVTEENILRFGEFTLKSGRKSPYFFNAGLFSSGASLSQVGSAYAAAIADAEVDFDVLFGPAYKGIPLVSASAIALAQAYSTNKPYCFNRKEAKDHGEGGNIVGAELEGRVLIIDDVITAGTAIREVVDLITDAGAEAVGVVVALDRQEKGQGELSAIQEIEADYGIPVLSIINLQQILDYLSEGQNQELQQFLPQMQAYQKRYGI